MKMAPDAKVIARVSPKEASVRALSEPGPRVRDLRPRRETKFELTLELPAGRYQAQWLNPRTGKIEKSHSSRAAAAPSNSLRHNTTRTWRIGIRRTRE